MKRLYTIFFIVLAVALPVSAQYDAVFSHYWAMEPSFNPAAVGKESKLNVNGAYAMTLTGFEHAPRTMYFGADMPLYFLKNYHGVGAQFLNDNIGLFSHKKVALQYSYKHRLLGGTIGIGLQLALLSEKFNGSQVDLENTNDPAFPTSDVNGSAFDFGLGLYYLRGAWYAGISAQHLTSPNVEIGETQSYKVEPAYYFTAGYNIKMRNPFLSIHPSVLARMQGSAYRVDVTARAKYTNNKTMMYAGVGYSPTNSVTAMVGGNFHGVCVGYSYEVYTSAISIGNGSHELFIGYQTDINLTKKGRNMHKSVRIL